jgi:polysaccharide export outer membrane protein
MLSRLLCLLLFLTLSVIPAEPTFAQQSPGLQAREAIYTLHRGDRLEIQYRYTPELNASVVIQPDGWASLPEVGSVRLEGLTLLQATDKVHEKASSSLVDPQITLLLKDFVPPTFTVSGEVVRPGQYDLHGEVSCLQAIAISGGFKEGSKRSQVILARRVSEDLLETRLLDMRRISTLTGIKEDVWLKPGDLLIVPANHIERVDRYIRWTSAPFAAAEVMALTLR